jgi:hypothetical protein
MTVAPPATGRRRLVSLVLLAVGAVVAVAGAFVTVTAAAAFDRAVRAASVIPTLPVGVYKQYTQHLAVPDDGGVRLGIAVAVVGVLVVAAGIVVAVRRPRVA